MFIVRRQVGEGFAIGEEITVRVLHDDEGGVYIGVDAPVTFSIESLPAQTADDTGTASLAAEDAVNEAA